MYHVIYLFIFIYIVCPDNTYANYITRTCVTHCPDLSADPLYLKDLYGDPASH